MDHRRLLPARSRGALAGGLLAATLLTGCSTDSTAADAETPTSTTTSDAGAFPVTIEHAFGETTIEEEPTRVVTLGWSDQDAVLSLGVVPVGATELTWGGNDAGSSDWFDARIEEMGAEAPVRYDDADGAPVEEIAKLAPDLVLATSSGITEKEYDRLSKIADVVAYPDAPWTTPWQTSLHMVGEALGRSALADEVETGTQEEIDDAKAAYPQLEGASLVFAYLTTTDLSTVGIYAPQDPRVSMMNDFGLVNAPVVDTAVGKGQFYGNVSAERAADLESDVLLTYAEGADDLETYADDPLLGRIPAIARGHAYAEVDKQVGLAVTNPSPLSIPYVIEHFLPHVADAVDGD
ncbi:iron-siderophore ABC transporter substrate-binding protein [Nocardioides sp. MAHUQ-72]|uniref:iron-siderophore ABC transporter substrate-binding protein n=1 Tax=unclassified Nocardioides TaxID=2615069 RepID=UPI00361AC449